MPDIKKKPSQEEIDLIILRLEAQSSKLYFASGVDFQGFSRDAMIEQIKDKTKVGKEFIKTELEFLRAIKDGSLNKELSASEE